MRWLWIPMIVFAVGSTGFFVVQHSGAQVVEKTPAKSEPSKARIVPVVDLKPGETKTMLLSTSCALLTRGRGLLVGEIKDGRFQNESKEWKRDGITVVFADVSGKMKESLTSKAGFNAFLVQVSAAKDARPGLINLHIADETCSGTCDTDFRVLVVRE